MATAADQAKLAGYIATYLSIPASKRTAAQNAALAKDQATYARQAAQLGQGGILSGTSSAQLGGSSFTGAPVGTGGTGGVAAGVTSGLGNISPQVLLIGGAALLVVLMLRGKR